jgi:hypothetical protein
MSCLSLYLPIPTLPFLLDWYIIPVPRKWKQQVSPKRRYVIYLGTLRQIAEGNIMCTMSLAD